MRTAGAWRGFQAQLDTGRAEEEIPWRGAVAGRPADYAARPEAALD